MFPIPFQLPLHRSSSNNATAQLLTGTIKNEIQISEGFWTWCCLIDLNISFRFEPANNTWSDHCAVRGKLLFWLKWVTSTAAGVGTRKWDNHTHASLPVAKSTDSKSNCVKLVNGNSILRHLRRQGHWQALWRALLRRLQGIFSALGPTQAQLGCFIWSSSENVFSV